MKKKSPEEGKGSKRKAARKDEADQIASIEEHATKIDSPKKERTRLGPAKVSLKLAETKRTGITQITIENFKGVADKVEIPIRPITLLFGANSAGKSTVLQALLYLRQLLEGGCPDADRLLAGGSSLDLGGFREFVHGRTRSNRIRIGVTIRLDDDGLPYVGWDTEDADEVPIAPELDGVREFSVDICVDWSNENWRPYITHYQVGLDGEPFAAIRTRPGGESQLDVVNLKHSLIALDDGGEATLFDELANAFNLNLILRPILGTKDDDVRGDQRLLLGALPVPDFGRGLPEKWAYPPLSEEQRTAAKRVFNVLNRAMTGAGIAVLSELRKFRYIGPIRRIPERNFQAVRSPGEDRWADGCGAWDLLLGEAMDHEWLDEEAFRDLGLGLIPRYQSYFEVSAASAFGLVITRYLGDERDSDVFNLLPENADDIDLIKRKSRLLLVSDDTDLELLPCDVGIGVSQAMPVAIGAMAPGYRVLAVEQPELHIHPAIQCNLGDLLAAQALKDEGRTILLETHSEHIILRMLRRIRENSENEPPEGAPPLKPEHLSVLWVEQDEGVVSIKHIPVNSQGDFDEQWPKGFFEERFDEYE